MASSTASSTCAAAKLAAVAARRPAPVTDRTGMAITGTISSAHAASTSAKPCPLGSSSSVDHTRLHPANSAKEVLLTPERTNPGTDTRARPYGRSLSCHPGGIRTVLNSIDHSPQPSRRRQIRPSCSAPKGPFGFPRNQCSASAETAVRLHRNTQIRHPPHRPGSQQERDHPVPQAPRRSRDIPTAAPRRTPVTVPDPA
jgi:hypothetical protein